MLIVKWAVFWNDFANSRGLVTKMMKHDVKFFHSFFESLLPRLTLKTRFCTVLRSASKIEHPARVWQLSPAHFGAKHAKASVAPNSHQFYSSRPLGICELYGTLTAEAVHWLLLRAYEHTPRHSWTEIQGNIGRKKTLPILRCWILWNELIFVRKVTFEFRISRREFARFPPLIPSLPAWAKSEKNPGRLFQFRETRGNRFWKRKVSLEPGIIGKNAARAKIDFRLLFSQNEKRMGGNRQSFFSPLPVKVICENSLRNQIKDDALHS